MNKTEHLDTRCWILDTRRESRIENRKSRILLLVVFLALLPPLLRFGEAKTTGAAVMAGTRKVPDLLEWSQLPPLPDPIGFAGPFVGVSNDALIVAGGTNFPEGPSWEGYPKVWYDQVFVLTDPEAKWTTGFKLQRPLGYGVSVTWNKKIVCLGGGDRDRHYADAFILYWTGNKLETIPLPPMPRPSAFSAGVLVDNIVYVAGGQEMPSSTVALRNFWSLDLSGAARNMKWEQLKPWPGKARILPVMATQEGDVFLISGTRLYKGTDGKATREFLTDCYRYNPQSKRWKRIADAPRPIAAAPNPGIPLGHAHILFMSGDDGENFFLAPLESPETRVIIENGRFLTGQAAELKDKHPGFNY